VRWTPTHWSRGAPARVELTDVEFKAAAGGSPSPALETIDVVANGSGATFLRCPGVDSPAIGVDPAITGEPPEERPSHHGEAAQ
jgi:hypothetical protein